MNQQDLGETFFKNIGTLRGFAHWVIKNITRKPAESNDFEKKFKKVQKDV